MVFGMVLLPSAFRADLHTGLKAGGRGGSTSSHWRVLRNVLVVTEIALSLALSIGAGLLIRSLSKLQNTRPGFQADRVLTFQLSLPDTRYKGQRVPDFYRRVIEGLGRLGAVEQAAVARNVPMAQGDPSVNFVVEGRAALVAAEQPRAQFRTVSADYFRALRIPLLRGRYLEPGDGADANKVAVINEAMAKQAFSGEDPIGRRIQNGFDESPWYTIVGIVGDVRHRGLDADARPEMYYPYQQVPESLLNFIEGTMTVVIRTRANPRAVLADARRVVRDVDSAQPLHNVRTMEELIYSNSAQPRFRTRLLGLFAALAVLLMIVGLYSVISHSVSERTREIAIRMSIGARTGDVLRLIVGHGLLLAGIGILAGLILSAGLVRGLRTMLYGVSSYDPVTIAGVVALVLGTAFLASFVPARKAASIDPLVALRSE
jgi:predicted permease